MNQDKPEPAEINASADSSSSADNAKVTSAQTLSSLQSSKPHNSKLLIATSIFCAILAVAGIAFGIYGMFLKPASTCETNCTAIPDSANDNADTKGNDKQSSDSAISPVSVEQATTLLDEKYNFKNRQMVIFDGWHNYIKNFNQANKLLLTIYQIQDELGQAQPADGDKPVVVYNIGFEDFKAAYENLFGTEEQLDKKDYELNGVYLNMEYNSEDDSFDIYSKTGLGGYSTMSLLRKVVETIGTNDGFKAIVATVTLNEVASQSTDEFLGKSGDGQGNEYYNIIMPEGTVNEIRESLAVYEFNFIKEGDDYKLTTVTEL